MAPYRLSPFQRIINANFGADYLFIRALANNFDGLAISLLTTIQSGTLSPETLLEDYGSAPGEPDTIQPWSARANLAISHWGQKLWTEGTEDFVVRWTVLNLTMLRPILDPVNIGAVEFVLTRDWVAEGGFLLNSSQWQLFTYRGVSSVSYVDQDGEYALAILPDSPISSKASDNANLIVSGSDPLNYYAEESVFLNFNTLELS